jgi:hypothetical protein
MVAELAPVGPMEAFLVQRIVRLTWRLIRAERMQDHSIDYLGLQELCGYRAENFRSFYISANRIYDDDPQIPREHLWLGRLAVCDFTNYRVLEKMQLYERRLENSLHKSRAELEKLQAARRARQKASQQSMPADDEANLKKQSQSPNAMSTRAAVTTSYVDTARPGASGSETANRQFKGPGSARRAAGPGLSSKAQGRLAPG